MKEGIRILFVEDDENDVFLICREISRDFGQLRKEVVTTGQELAQALSEDRWDLVITDYVLPQYSGLEAITYVKSVRPDLPCIMISGKAGEETAVEAMRAGASDFILKGSLMRLLPVIRRELAESAIRRDKQIMEQQQLLYHRVLETINEAGKQEVLIESILLLIQQSSGIGSVKLRLRDQGDFPFYTGKWCLGEACYDKRYLIMKDDEGNIIRDPGGMPRYECLCGMVINSLSSPLPPEISRNGNILITNSMHFREFAVVHGEGLALRNTCIREGLESIAILPLRYGDDIIGLLHLGDKRPGLFTHKDLKFFEGICDALAIAIKRNQDEIRIRESEEKFRSIIENSGDAIVVTDEEGKIITWNKAAEEIMGIQSDDTLGRPLWEIQGSVILPGFDKESFTLAHKNMAGEMLRWGTSDHPDQLFTTRFQKPTGEEVSIQTRIFSFRTIKGHILGSISRDVTELENARIAEMQHYKALETLAGTAIDFLYMESEGEIYEYISERIRDLTGDAWHVITSYDEAERAIRPVKIHGVSKEILLRLSEISRTDIQNLMFPLGDEGVRNLCSGKVGRADYNFRDILGHQYGPELSDHSLITENHHVFYIGLSDKDDLFGSVGIITDDESKINKPVLETFVNQAAVNLKKNRTIKALEHSQVRLNSLFEQNMDIVFTLNRREMLTSINPIGERLISGKFRPGLRIRDYMPRASYLSLQKVFRETVAARLPFCTCELEINARNGSVLAFQGGFSIEYTGDEVKEIFGIARNITGDKSMQNQVLSLIIETEEREKKTFAAELHDGLGSLLSTINIYIGLLKKEDKSAEEKKAHLDSLSKLIHEAVMNVRFFANSLTPNVLNDFGLLMAVSMYVEKINATRPGLITLILPDKKIKAENIIEINIYRIILELINNSLKYSGASAILIKISEKNQSLFLSYQDNGKGFDLQRVTSSETSGMGIKNIYTRTKSLNGYINISSKEGKGLKVSIQIPYTIK